MLIKSLYKSREKLQYTVWLISPIVEYFINGYLLKYHRFVTELLKYHPMVSVAYLPTYHFAFMQWYSGN
jgi:hypothetical protein